MQKYMQIKDLSIAEVADTLEISPDDLQLFLQGKTSIDTHHFETLNGTWPEMVAYIFNIDASLCQEIPISIQ
ncbi:hypothetical protein J3998_11245 [Thiomicrorhabdus sp. 6S2-11]|uniref:XRE family transcriptional regulator n=1 Tax=Thiomicrorhabdus marina TaxID=2818442 RepID=A0ABS3Q8K4_9GAMM|nr:hypothetical protein [Thiomicrorhabdus marina]MBO1928150.1 hypothetical protein [Thiomicrorhabdus marina]